MNQDPLPTTGLKVPYFRPSITRAEIDEVVACLESGWLTTGPRTAAFENQFSQAVGSRHAVAVNSCTAALHLAVDALGLGADEGVLVPTMTFAATAEVVRYQRALPILVDCDPDTLNIDLEDAHRKLVQAQSGNLTAVGGRPVTIVGIIPVHVGGLMGDVAAIRQFAQRHSLWIVEDAAHAFPAAWRTDAAQPWQRCGEHSADVTCFSFYANKTITTGEGGMAVTDRDDLADAMRTMSLHGLSRDAWTRYSGGAWDYRIEAPGYKYNLTDLAAAIGLHQLARANCLRAERQRLAYEYLEQLAHIEELQLPGCPPNRLHAWHLFRVALRLDRLTIARDTFLEHLKYAGVGCSVHWRPLHLHPYYEATFGWRPSDLPVASYTWLRQISLPLFPGMTSDEQRHVIGVLENLCRQFRRRA